MPDAKIYVKTDKGREEIATRRYGLSQDERVALILVNGKRTMVRLVEQLSRAGLSEALFAKLAADGFIALLGAAVEQGFNTRPAIVYDEPESELPLRWLDSHTAHSAEDRTAQLRWFMVDAVTRLAPEGAMPIVSAVERAATFDDLVGCAVDFERLVRNSADEAAVLWTVARLRTLINP
jgi:hypothetical protein